MPSLNRKAGMTSTPNSFKCFVKNRKTNTNLITTFDDIEFAHMLKPTIITKQK